MEKEATKPPHIQWWMHNCIFWFMPAEQYCHWDQSR